MIEEEPCCFWLPALATPCEENNLLEPAVGYGEQKHRLLTSGTVVKTLDDRDDFCAICHRPTEEHNRAYLNECCHSFCFEDIERWSKIQNTCPLCRVRFTNIHFWDMRTNTTGVLNVNHRNQLRHALAIDILMAGQIFRVVLSLSWIPLLFVPPVPAPSSYASSSGVFFRRVMVQ